MSAIKETADGLTLEGLRDGEAGVVTRIRVEGPTKRRLIEMGITPGTRITVAKRAPLNDPIEVRLRGYSLTLRAQDARLIDIRHAENAGRREG